jgi:hypothetical protein
MKQMIRKLDLRNLRQAEIAPIAQNVAMRVREYPDYQEALPLVEQLEQKNAQYTQALADSVYGGMDRVAVKQKAKDDLLQALFNLADWVNGHDTGAGTWFINAGFFTNVDRTHKNAPLLPPIRFRAMPQETPGTLELRFAHPDARAVRTTCLEYSLDAGQNWLNGAYSARMFLKVMGLPSRQTVLFRVRSIGQGQRVSAWTEPIEVYLF